MVIYSLSFRRTVYPTIYVENIDNPNGNLHLRRAGSLKLEITATQSKSHNNLSLAATKSLRDTGDNIILDPDDSGAITTLANVANAATIGGNAVVTPPLYGVANKEWVGCSFVGETTNFGYNWLDATQAVTNIDDNNAILMYFVPLPTNLYGKKLYLKDVRVAITDADVGDLLSQVKVVGMLYGANVSLNTNNDDINAPAKNVTSFTAVALDAYAHAYIKLALFCTNAGDIDIETVEVEAYYDT